MRLVGFIIRHFIPIGLIGAFGTVLVTSALPGDAHLFDSFGLEVSALPTFTSENVSSQMDLVAATGVKYLRLEVNWSEIETAADVYDWNATRPLDQIITAANDRDIEVVAVLNGGPTYLAVPGQLLDQAAVGKRWEAFVRAAAEHFGDTINTWEIGRNINSSRGISPFLSPLDPDRLLNPDPTFYTKLLVSASKIIHSIDASDQVWMGSLTGLAANDCLLSPLTFLLEVHAAGGWKYADAIPYSPRQGSAVPEATPAGMITSACGTNLMTTPVSMAEEVRAVQELVRQLGTKPLVITNLDWKNPELKTLNKGRTITNFQLKADLLTRASVALVGQNAIPVVFWNMNITKNNSGSAAITNLQSTLENSQSLGQVQGASGAVQEYRFRNGSDLYALAWRSVDGDEALPVNLDFEGMKTVIVYPLETYTGNTSGGTELTLEPSGQALMMLNERPVILRGRSGNLAENLQAETNQQVEILREEINKVLRSWGNQVKSAFLRILDKWFDAARQDAVEWGEGVINELLP